MDMLKKMWNSFDENNKKIIKMIGIGVGALILIIVVIAIYRAIAGVKMDYNAIETKIDQAVEKYLKDNEKYPDVDDTVTIDSSTLISTEYLKDFSKYTNDTGCSSKTIVENNNGLYHYMTKLKCANYETETLEEKLVSKVVIDGDGLYDETDSYVFKGEFVDNYVKVGSKLYRVVNITDGYIKLVNVDETFNYSPWDDRYNSEMKYNAGINNYSLSRLKEKVDTVYKKYSDVEKKYIVKYNWCIDKYNRDASNFTGFCQEFYTDYVSVLDLIDYVDASLDLECVSFRTNNCNNYNYLKKVVGNSHSSNSSNENTHETYRLFAGNPINEAIESTQIFESIAISGTNVFISGNGTETDPYIIK